MAEYLKELYSWIAFVPNMTLKNILEIVIIAFVVYEVLVWIKNTRAWTCGCRTGTGHHPLAAGEGILYCHHRTAYYIPAGTQTRSGTAGEQKCSDRSVCQ